MQENFLTFSLFDFNWATTNQMKESILLFETISKYMKDFSPRDKKAYQILAIFSHATFAIQIRN